MVVDAVNFGTEIVMMKNGFEKSLFFNFTYRYFSQSYCFYCIHHLKEEVFGFSKQFSNPKSSK